MGFLEGGEPLSWDETARVADYIKEHGIIQFLRLYEKVKDRRNDCLKWGDEIEYRMFLHIF